MIVVINWKSSNASDIDIQITSLVIVGGTTYFHRLLI